MTKIIIRQEDQLAELRGDKGFFMFLREDPEMSAVIMAARQPQDTMRF